MGTSKTKLTLEDAKEKSQSHNQLTPHEAALARHRHAKMNFRRSTENKLRVSVSKFRVGFQNRTRKKKFPNTSPCLNIGSPSKIQSLKVRSQTRNGHRQIRSRKKQTKERRMHPKKMQLNLNQKKMPLRKTRKLIKM